MKVVHIHWGLNFGGIETMLVNIANAQVKLGADVYLIIVNDLKEQSLINALDKRVHFICLNRKVGSKNPLFILKLKRLLKRIKPDAIHLQHSEFYAILPKDMKKIASATVHDIAGGSIRRKGLLPKFFPVLNFYKKDNSNVVCIDEIPHVFAISKAVQKSILDKYGIKSIVVENGIRTDMFQHRNNRYPDENKPFKIVCVSRLDYKKKGQDLLIKAASMLKNKAIVTLIGDGASMDYLKDLDRQTGGVTEFLGKKPQTYIEEHLKDYDLFVQPSRLEGFGLTVAEAMAANVPVLVSSGQGPAEITENDTYGWTFETNDVEDLKSKIEYIITHYDKALEKALKANEHVRKNFDVSVTAKNYLEKYRS